MLLCKSITVNSQDSTLIANDDLKAGVHIVEEWKFMKLELKAKDENLVIMQKQIDLRSSQIKRYQSREATFNNLIKSYKVDSTAMRSQIDAYRSIGLTLKNQLTVQRTKTTVAIIVGIVISLATAYLTTR